MRINHLIILLLLLSTPLLAHTSQKSLAADSSKIIFEAYGKKGIKNIQGKILLAPKYEALSWESNPNDIALAIIPYKKHGHWGILDENLKEVTDAKFTTLIPFDESTLIAAIKGKYSQTIFYGLVNLDGKVKLPFNYRKLSPANDLLIGASKNKQSIYYGLLDDKGRSVTPFQYYQINFLGEGYFVLTDSTGTSSVVYKNSIYEPLIKDVDSASIFKNDLAIIYQAGKVGMLHNNGKLVLPIIYKKIERNDGKLMTVTSFKKWKMVDASGEPFYEIFADSIHLIARDKLIITQNGLSFLQSKKAENKNLPLGGRYIGSWDKYFLIKKGKQTVVIDSANAKPIFQLGELIESNNYFLIGRSKEFLGNSYTVLNRVGDKRTFTSFDLNENLLTVESNGFWGIYDEAFKERIPPIYGNILPGNSNQFIVKFQGDYGVINDQLGWVISPEMLKIETISPTVYWTVDKKLREKLILNDTVIEADLHFLKEGTLLFESNNEGYIRLISDEGHRLMSYVKGKLYDQDEDGFIIKNNREFKYFNLGGEQMFSAFDYDSIGLLKAEFLPIKKGGAYGFIDFKGKLRVANRYQGIYPFSEGLAAVNINGKWGFINKEEVLVIQPYYDKVSSFLDGRTVVRRDGKYGLIDNLGNIIIEIEYDKVIEQGNYYLLLKGLKWGFANAQGNIISYPNYDSISILNNYCLVERYNQYELINGKGQNLFDHRFSGIYWDDDFNIYTLYEKGSKEITFLSDLKSGLVP